MELLRRQERWDITYTHALGETASWFYVQIRDRAKIYGKRDATTGRVLCPPRAFSDQSLMPTTDWVEVGPGGVIEAFTIVYDKFNNLPDPPYAFGYVMLDGADTAIGGYFKGVELTDGPAAARKLAIGTRVITRFAEKRVGDMLDFWFEPAVAG
jgi:uncharacterized OB-fold protein